jgi:hypothetical protein
MSIAVSALDAASRPPTSVCTLDIDITIVTIARSDSGSATEDDSIESTVRYLGVEVDDALAISESIDI